MVSTVDVETAMSRVLQADGEVIEKGGLTPANGILQTEAGNVRVRGDIVGGVQVKVADALIVEGAVVGEIGKPCCIEAEGDVIITGQVQHARISAQNIYIGGEVRSTELVSSEHIDIAADLIDAIISSGDLATCERKIRKHQVRLTQRLDKIQVLQKQLERDEMQLHKQCDRTSAGLNFRVAEIVHHDRDRIRVDLGKFYQYVEDKTEEEVSKALKEFFAKGILGLLSRNNRAYIVENRSHEKVYLQLTQSLRKLVFLARRVDLLKGEVDREKDALAALARHFNNSDRSVAVRGKIYPETNFKVLPRVVDIAIGGGIVSVGQSAELNVAAGAGSGERKLTRRSIDGQQQIDALAAETLRGVALRLDGEHVVWRRIDPPAQVAV